MSVREQTEKNGGEPGFVILLKCPRCGMFLDYSRRYCDCHEKIPSNAPAYIMDPDQARDEAARAPNVETAEINCRDCGLGCEPRHCFALLKEDKHGFGGDDCRRRRDDIVCTCCRAVIRAFKEKRPLEEAVEHTLELVKRRHSGAA